MNSSKLQSLKEMQRQKHIKSQTETFKQNIIAEIQDFNDKYYFVEQDTIDKVNERLSHMPKMLGTIPDFKLFSDVEIFTSLQTLLNFKGNAWCKLAYTPQFVSEVMPYGRVANFVQDIDVWLYFSSPIYLICEDKSNIIFIRDNLKATKATIVK